MGDTFMPETEESLKKPLNLVPFNTRNAEIKPIEVERKYKIKPNI